MSLLRLNLHDRNAPYATTTIFAQSGKCLLGSATAKETSPKIDMPQITTLPKVVDLMMSSRNSGF